MTDKTKQNLFDICMKHDDVMIVDVLNYLHRYLWVNQDMSVVIDGEPVYTGHLYGFTRLMIYLKDKYPNCAIILALDGIDKSRRQVNSEYKAQRDHTYRVDAEMDELLKMCALVDGVYSCLDDNYEADDVINVVSTKVRELCLKNSIKKNIYILSTDKDMYQLVVDDDICPIHIIKKFGYGGNPDDVVDESVVRAKFDNVSPRDLVKYRAIVGDASDNLRGYYRFRRSNAAIIAQNFDYDTDKQLLYLKEGVKPCLSWKKFLPTVVDNMQVFRDNYFIMKLKDFDFEIENLKSLIEESSVNDVVGIIKKYRLNRYMNSLCAGKYSSYREDIVNSRPINNV